MPSIARSALVNYSAAQMYSLVCDIESYSQFLPWCDSTKILEQSDIHQVASVSVDRRMKGVSFTTRNTLKADESVHMSLVSGPFKRFGGVWTFKAIDDTACQVELSMDFEFQSRILGALLGPAFIKICDSMVAAFVKRASTVY
ncbi:MAG: ribosome-associated toxin RatA of RatAB toxin-antitoxin module [Granulosicoccus sp.]|jgi:ribosome-associated toxin RatA of RatAB toxin-antitoxin module